jgi:hypothetical protein
MIIYVNDKPFDVAMHYARRGYALPATPSMSIIELAVVAGYDEAQLTYRKDASPVSALGSAAFCVVECDEHGKWSEPVWTTLQHGTRAIALKSGQRFAAFPDGSY